MLTLAITILVLLVSLANLGLNIVAYRQRAESLRLQALANNERSVDE
jgi:hypothetical protein